jgi:hypothetical protein
MVTGEAAGAPRSSLVMVERSTPLILASSCWVSCLRWRSFFRLVSLRTLQILTKLVHAAQAASLSLFTGLPTRLLSRKLKKTEGIKRAGVIGPRLFLKKMCLCLATPLLRGYCRSIFTASATMLPVLAL